MATTITATQLARNLSDVLNRARYKGESFQVERNGEVVAEIKPALEEKQFSVADFVEFWERVPKPGPAFGMMSSRRTAW